MKNISITIILFIFSVRSYGIPILADIDYSPPLDVTSATSVEIGFSPDDTLRPKENWNLSFTFYDDLLDPGEVLSVYQTTPSADNIFYIYLAFTFSDSLSSVVFPVGRGSINFDSSGIAEFWVVPGVGDSVSISNVRMFEEETVLKVSEPSAFALMGFGMLSMVLGNIARKARQQGCPLRGRPC